MLSNILALTSWQALLTIVLLGDHTATALATGFTSCSTSPVLDLCRQLIAAGYDPKTPAVAYRDGDEAFLLKSIGEVLDLNVVSVSDVLPMPGTIPNVWRYSEIFLSTENRKGNQQ
jgi:hypothetical protein